MRKFLMTILLMAMFLLMTACTQKTENKEITEKSETNDCGGCTSQDCEKSAEETTTAMAHGEIKWGHNIDSALTIAAKNGKILMIDFMADWCPPCREMEKVTFPDAKVIAKAGHFIPVRINVDENQEVAKEYNGNAGKYGGIGIPNILFIDKDKNIKRHVVGFHDAEKLVSVMDSVLTGKYED